VFDIIRHKRHGDAAVLCAFDLIELDGDVLFFSLGLRLIVRVLNYPHSALTREPVPHFGRVLQLLSLFQRFHLTR